MTKKGNRKVLTHIFLILVSLISIFPLYYMIISSTNTSPDVLKARMVPGSALPENFRKLINETNFLSALKNSILVAFFGTILSVLINGLAGYGFEIYHSKAKDTTMSILLLSMMVPGAATMIPMYVLFAKLGLLNSVPGYILPFLSSAFLIMLFRQNTRSFPYEIVESARVDGLSELGIFFRMYFPTMKGVFATGAIVSFMNLWNEYLWGLVVMQSQESLTLPLVLANLNQGYSIDYGLIMLLATLTTLPLAVMFFALQKYFTAGLTGSVKG